MFRVACSVRRDIGGDAFLVVVVVLTFERPVVLAHLAICIGDLSGAWHG